MNFPVWDVSFGIGILMAIVSVTHVFVSHFAVGGGLFLVLTEKKAYRENDNALLEWLIRHTKFFVLVTVVFGAVSGVGIWFTIQLIHPSGTSSLIHSYVWGWAIEWVFFFLEIAAALFYLYGWRKLNRETHLWFGWIYFIAAFASMVIINGIVSFMLTSGKWVETHQFWHGFFNPTYFPSLFIRFIFALALAGVYALLTGSFQKDEELKGKVVKWSARWIIPAFIVLPFISWWYIGSVPAEVWDYARGKMPTATRYANVILIFSIITFVLSLLTLIKPRKTPVILSFAVLLSAFMTMWGFEFVREAIRKPYIIYNYMYANSIYKNPVPGDAGMNVRNINETGILKVARWSRFKEVTAENRVEAGRDIFRIECQSCHTIDGYRSIRKIVNKKRWGYSAILSRLGALDKMYGGVMPPFVGLPQEKEALARFLATLSTVREEAPPEAQVQSGEALFEQYCSDCHGKEAEDPLFEKFGKLDEPKIDYLITRLDSLNEEMPPFEGSDRERAALARWIYQQFK